MLLKVYNMARRVVAQSKDCLNGFRLDFNKDYMVEGVNMDYAVRSLEKDFELFLSFCYGLNADSDVYLNQIEAGSAYYGVQCRLDFLHDLRLIDFDTWHNLWHALDSAYYYWFNNHEI